MHESNITQEKENTLRFSYKQKGVPTFCYLLFLVAQDEMENFIKASSESLRRRFFLYLSNHRIIKLWINVITMVIQVNLYF